MTAMGTLQSVMNGRCADGLNHPTKYNATRSVVHVATPVPKKSASSVHTGQPIAMAHARTGQSHPGRWPCHSCGGGLGLFPWACRFADSFEFSDHFFDINALCRKQLIQGLARLLQCRDVSVCAPLRRDEVDAV